MKITKEMMAEDEKLWNHRNVVIELGYCGNYMRDRKYMTNLDIRFYAYIMRKAHAMLKAQEQKIFELEGQLRLLEYGDQETQNGVMMPAT